MPYKTLISSKVDVTRCTPASLDVAYGKYHELGAKLKKILFSSVWAKPRTTTLVIILLNLFVQFLLIGIHLDNSIISGYAPTAVDAADYVTRAQIWETKGFSTAFGDAYRMPGYPFIIAVLHYVFPGAPYLAVRLLQMLGLALSAGLIKVLLERVASAWIAILGGLLFTILPFWHFVPVLLAESLTSTLVVTLLFILSLVSKLGISRNQLIAVSFLIAGATYLKPNNLLLLIPVITFLCFRLEKRLAKSISAITLSISLLLLPWVCFTSSVQPGFLGLTTNSGINSFIGTGMVLNYDGGVLAKSAIKWKVDPRNNPEDVLRSTPGLTPAQQNSMLVKKSAQIWHKRTWSEIGFGFDKALIAFGIKSNSLFDHVFGLFSLLSMLAGIVLLTVKKFRAWGSTMLVTVGLLAVQAAIFQADRRFVVPVLFPVSVICLGLTLSIFSIKISTRRRIRNSS